MGFPFPGIATSCLLCGGPCGAIYRGYYRRRAIVPEGPFEGAVAIRTAFCRRLGVRYAVFPSFLVPFRPFSREGFRRLVEAWRRRQGSLTESVDAWWAEIEREVYLAVSTLYAQLRFVVRELRLLRTPSVAAVATVQRLRCVADLAAVADPVIAAGIAHPAFGCGASLRIDPPPDEQTAGKPRVVKPLIGPSA
jgi:hypothetical protein